MVIIKRSGSSERELKGEWEQEAFRGLDIFLKIIPFFRFEQC